MKKQILTLAAAASLLLWGSAPAQATLTLKLDDGNPIDIVTVTDNGPGDINTNVGAITFSGSVGLNWTVAIGGLSKPIAGSASSPELDLNTQNISSGMGTLKVELSDTGFTTSSPVTFLAAVGGTFVYTDGSVTFTNFADGGNALFAETINLTSQGPFSTSPFGATNQSGVQNLGGSPYSLTLDTTITHNGFGISGFDASLSGSPCQTSVCGYVFVDCDGDGFLTPGLDYGMSNVVVILKNSQNVAVATNRTDSQGSYCFYGLTAGTYTVCINQPTNCNQTAGTHCNHWLNNSYQQCWIENDGYQHWKGGDGVDCWKANDGYQHWKNSNNQDCWKDKYGWSHTQSCNYVSCDVPKGNCETFTLAACQALTNVSFAYQGILVKPVVCVTGPSKGICGKTGTYTCYVTNAGTACIPTCQVTVCGKTYNCPPLIPGQGCSFTFNYQFQYWDYGTFNCKATATCTYSGNSNNSNNWNSWNNWGSNWGSWGSSGSWGSWGSWGNSNSSNSGSSCTASGSCYTSVGYW
jgi:hypothetical protein